MTATGTWAKRPNETARRDYDEALALLRRWVQPGDTLRTILRHRSASGMTRWISVIQPFVRHEGTVGFRELSWHAAKVIGRSVNSRNHEGVECGGAGMDMGFELVYSLSRTLFPEGFDCIGPDCPSNDHMNNRWDPALIGPGVHHNDGGYALRQEWL